MVLACLLPAGCYDALSGKVLAEAGHKAAFVSGYAVRMWQHTCLFRMAGCCRDAVAIDI
jgi:hypothetical protein